MNPEEVTQNPDETTSLAQLSPETVKQGLVSAVQKRMIDRYADDVLKMIEEKASLAQALKRYEDWLTRVDSGDVSAVKEFRKERKRLEDEDGYEL